MCSMPPSGVGVIMFSRTSSGGSDDDADDACLARGMRNKYICVVKRRPLFHAGVIHRVKGTKASVHGCAPLFSRKSVNFTVSLWTAVRKVAAMSVGRVSSGVSSSPFSYWSFLARRMPDSSNVSRMAASL